MKIRFNGLRCPQGWEDCALPSGIFTHLLHFTAALLTEHKSEPEAVQECHIQVKMEAVPCFILSAVWVAVLKRHNGAFLCCSLCACVVSERYSGTLQVKSSNRENTWVDFELQDMNIATGYCIFKPKLLWCNSLWYNDLHECHFPLNHFQVKALLWGGEYSAYSAE